jgi:Flp pilus assembly protein TadD
MDDKQEQPDNSSESTPAKATSTLLAKIPQLQPAITWFKGLLPKIQAFYASWLAKVKKLPPIKTAIMVGSVVAVIIIYSVYSHLQQRHQMRQQAITLIIAQASTKQDIKQYLGLPIVIGKSVEGDVSDSAANAQLTLAVSGPAGQGSLVATLADSQVTALMLTLANGQQYNVLDDEAKFQAAQAAKVAEAARQAALATAFEQAVQAIAAKNYTQAIPALQQSIQNQYKVAESYQYLGLIYSQTGQYQSCIEAFQQFIKLQSNNAEAYYQMAYCNLQLYQAPPALENLQKACDLGYQDACAAAKAVQAQMATPQPPQAIPSTPEPSSAPTSAP